LKQAQSDVVTQLFISYSHADNALRKRLEIHLTILKRQGVIRMWNDLAIEPGKPKSSRTCKSRLLFLLLVSADFLASDFCQDIELTLDGAAP
jgi:hypothetical protein